MNQTAVIELLLALALALSWAAIGIRMHRRIGEIARQGVNARNGDGVDTELRLCVGIASGLALATLLAWCFLA